MANKKVVFIDERVGDLDALVAQWHEDSDVYILDQGADGLTQMTEILGSRSELQSIHIVSHGSVGSLLLGSTLVNAGALADHQLALQSIGQSLAVGGDILLYGCDVGAGEIGQSFIDQIAVMMGANVAASNDATGATLNVDWDLEVRSGTVDSALLQAAGGKTANLSTIVVNVATDGPVNHADDATVMTLRDAIDLANTRSGADTIIFSGPMSVGLSVDYGELLVNDTADDQLSIVGGGTVSLFGVTSHTANPAGRVMFVDEGSLAISGITFSSGRAVGGGVSYYGNGGGGLGAGGAIFINHAKVEISDSAFNSNSATGGAGGGRYLSYAAAGTGGGGLHANGNSAVFDGGNGGGGWSAAHEGWPAFGGADGGGLAAAANWLSFGATMGTSGTQGGFTNGMPGGVAGIGGGGGGGGGRQSGPAGTGGPGGQGGAGGFFGGGGGGGQGGVGGAADGLLYGGLGGAGGNGGSGGWGGGGGGGGNGGTGGSIGHVRGGVTGGGGAGGAGGDGGFGGGGGKGGVGGGWGAGGYYTAAGQRGANGNVGKGGLFGGDGAVDYGGGGAGLGGAIFVNGGGELIITNSSFSKNSASGGVSGGGTAEAGEGHGGAIFALGSLVTDASVTFGTGTNANSASTADENLNAPVSQTLLGSSAPELIQGGAGNDSITGLAGNDTILGGAGDDTLTGGADNDSIDGGVGLDLAIYSGALHNYTLTKAGSSYSARAKTSTDGTDTLTNIESLKFTDFTVNLTVQASAASIAPATLQRLEELYVAFFNRIPDADGLAYWIDQFKAGSSVNQIADIFYSVGASAQYSSLTGFSTSMTNTDFINVFYKNVLGRPEGADAGGLVYWSGKLADGSSTRSSLASDILTAAHTYKGDPTWGWVADLLDNKAAVSNKIAVDWGLNYNTDAYTHGVAIAAAVTSTSTDAAIALIGLTASDMQLA